MTGAGCVVQAAAHADAKLARRRHPRITALPSMQREPPRGLIPTDANGRELPLLLVIVVAFVRIQREAAALSRINAQM